MTAQMFLVFEIWRFLIYVFFSKIKEPRELEILKRIVGSCQGALSGCKLGVQIKLLKSFGFRYMAFFMIKKNSKNSDVKKLTELEILNLIVGCSEGTLRGCAAGVQLKLLKSFPFLRTGVFYGLIFFLKKHINKLNQS